MFWIIYSFCQKHNILTLGPVQPLSRSTKELHGYANPIEVQSILGRSDTTLMTSLFQDGPFDSLEPADGRFGPQDAHGLPAEPEDWIRGQVPVTHRSEIVRARNEGTRRREVQEQAQGVQLH